MRLISELISNKWAIVVFCEYTDETQQSRLFDIPLPFPFTPLNFSSVFTNFRYDSEQNVLIRYHDDLDEIECNLDMSVVGDGRLNAKATVSMPDESQYHTLMDAFPLFYL